MDTQPFLTAAEFAQLIAPRVLTAGETALVGLLVQAAADWIRDPSRRPGLARTDPLGATQAKLITYEVVSAALGAAGVDPQLGPRVRQVMSNTDGRQLSVTYADAARLLEFDDRHLAALGLSTSAAPQAFFGNDRTGAYGASFADAFTEPGPRRW
ncbi:hypothetical protein LV457_02880 [Mycobacterium sp. MYCO198283]|uniref:hypothetical protein n=1 Tax=Mycobacterium sp. MYCO198283 TaxID=2883505 RepID=UPI001E2F2371|nr:hypothetical protein [Mycobacterium sp. MYCO198283]MCG5431234.1 hypothetical protein [Mycobacterium sp. MYCO198283]